MQECIALALAMSASMCLPDMVNMGGCVSHCICTYVCVMDFIQLIFVCPKPCEVAVIDYGDTRVR